MLVGLATLDIGLKSSSLHRFPELPRTAAVAKIDRDPKFEDLDREPESFGA